jgi:putative CocE/NonD family hydrolase
MSVFQLLSRLRSSNVRIWTSDGQLHYEAHDGAVDDELRDWLASCEQEVVNYLENADDCEHTTRYVVMRDGVRLAADIFRPKRNGVVIEEPLPVIWCHDRYRRSDLEQGMVWTKLDSRPWLRAVLRQGYVVCAVDARGTGASTGSRRAEFGADETRDAYDVTEWLATQPWCNERVGMYGDSYLAVTQFLAASAAPPHLRAIFPEMPLFDLHSFLYPGGVFRRDFVLKWGERVRRLDSEHGVVPVAGDQESVRRAVLEHRDNDDVLARAAHNPFRDSRNEDDGELSYRQSPAGFVAAVNASNVPVYQLSGWYDMWVRDALLWFTNLRTPKKLTIGRFCHTGREEVDLVAEHLRWFDHWLKDVDTGIMAEPPIRYRTINAAPGHEWRTAAEWPPAGVLPTAYYFREGPSDTVQSPNDGLLSVQPVPGRGGSDEYVVDYTTTSGRSTRWANGYGGEFDYGSMTDNDRKGLTYTTAPLAQALEVTGHPVVHLYVTSTHPDGDFFVYLEEVDERGKSRYVTEGVMRASSRALGDPPFDYLDLPYPQCTADSRADLPSVPVPLVLDLHPTSFVFAEGRRVRVTITCCDRDNASTPVHQPGPVVRVHRQARYPSRIDLPVMTADFLDSSRDR